MDEIAADLRGYRGRQTHLGTVSDEIPYYNAYYGSGVIVILRTNYIKKVK